MKLDMAGTGAQRKKPCRLVARNMRRRRLEMSVFRLYMGRPDVFATGNGSRVPYICCWKRHSSCFLSFLAEKRLVGFFTLGVQEANPWFGIEGDNSITMLIWGIFAIIMIVVAVMVAWASVKSTYYAQCRVKKGEKPETFRQTLANLLDKNFYKTALFLPVISVCVFNILPIVFYDPHRVLRITAGISSLRNSSTG